MAEIYLARAETELGATRLGVVKQILPAFADDPRFSEMLIHEAKLSARLSHRHIVQVFDLGRHEGHLYIAMEYVEGFDLSTLLRKCTELKIALPAQHALAIVADVLEGLDYAHRRTDDGDTDKKSARALGIVHRDVSPSNVLISYEGEVKLCDFGIAHANDLLREMKSEALKGKAGYMSPEHAAGEVLDARSDVFAAGIILWELLSGRRLYKATQDLSLLEQARRASIPAIVDKGLPNHARLEAIAMRALAKDRDARYPSAGAMLRDLEEYLADSGLLASRLKLGDWITTSFGTDSVERRRASERRLPKSLPPPRPSERVRAALPVPTDDEARAASSKEPEAMTATPPPPRPRSSPRALYADLPISDGAIRAFRRELEAKPEPSSAEGGALPTTINVPSVSAAAAVDDFPPKRVPPVDTSAAGRASSVERGRKAALLVVVALLAVVAALVAFGFASGR